MADDRNIHALQTQFPDMSQSVIGDVLKTYKGNKEEAAAALGGIDEQTKQEQKKKISELKSMFPIATEKDCREVLEATNWDVEAALVPLFNKNEENKQKVRKDKEDEIKKKRMAEAKRQSDNLMQIFHTIPNEEIQRLLDENEGDIEETTNMLLEIVGKQEEEKAKKKQAEEKRMREEQDKRLRELKLQALEEKFDYLSEHEVVSILDENDWDIKKAHLELVKLVSTKKRNHVKNVFPSLKPEQIETALELHDWDIVKTTQYLSEQLRDKKAPVVVKVNQQNLLERSIVMGKKIEEEVAASHLEMEKNLKEEGIATFKRDLEHIMKTQIRNPVAPGITPHPLPKQIDEMLNKKKPIEENDLPQPPMPHQDSRILEDKPVEDNSMYSVTLKAPENVDIGNTVTVTWEFTKGESTPNDWIGLFPVDQNNKNYLTYQWRGKTDTTKGSVTFTAPNFYGTYDFRYFIGKSYTHVAISNKVKVGPKVDLEASFNENKSKIIGKWNQVSGNKYTRAWVGLYEKSQTNNKLYLQWDYATGSEISFTCPVKPQEYELRFFTNSYEDVARSNPVRVEGEDRLSAALENGVIYVKPHIVSADPYCDNVWMGVFFTSEKDNRQFRRYKYVTDRDAEVRFKCPRTPGEYEVRLFANKTYDVIVKSNSFNIVKQ